MRNRLLVSVVAFALILVSGLALAEEVYITKSGSKYHAKDCPLVANRATQAIEREEAQARGLDACVRCIAEENVSSQEGKEQIKDAVYVTKSGTKYHKSGCQLIKNRSTTKVSLGQATESGLEPCGKCFKQAKAE